jgi:hypothetical protein
MPRSLQTLLPRDAEAISFFETGELVRRHHPSNNLPFRSHFANRNPTALPFLQFGMEASRHIVDLNVRCKRKRRDPQAAKPRGRPMKAASELKSRKIRAAPPEPSPPAKMRSWLERLPAELIEQVFLHALEINMAKASPLLGRILSSESIYRILILFAFFLDCGAHPVEAKHFAPAAYRLLGFEEKLVLQQGVLECRWCTLARVRQCLPTLRRLAMVQNWHQNRRWELHGANRLAVQRRRWQEEGGVGPSPQSPRPSSLPALDDTNAVYAFFHALNTTVCTFPSIADVRMPASSTILNVYCLPTRLLDPESWHDSKTTTTTTNTTPNNRDHFDFLTLLLHGYSCTLQRRSPPHSAIDHSALVHGMERAVREHHRQAITVLVQIHDEIFPDLFASPQMRSRRSHPNGGVPSRVLHLATRQGRESAWILKLLIWRPKEEDGKTSKGSRVRDIPRDDSVLTKWAVGQVEKGEQERDRSFAQWLLDWMEES